MQNGEIRTAQLIPEMNKDEYFQLAGYSYYRIVLLHILRGYKSDAITTYKTLHQKFPKGNPGYPYVELANAFMNKYENTHTMIYACSAAIQYAVENPEILTPLGSDYHGWQSHTYKPEDVCPFR